MQFQPIAAHPVFLPLAGLVAIVAAMVTLQVAAVPGFGTTASSAPPASSPAARTAAPAAAAMLSGTVTRVELARATGRTRDAVVVTHPNGSSSRLLLSAATRIVVPYGGRNVIGGPESLAVGGTVSYALVDGAEPQDGATIARITVHGADASAAPTAAA